MAAHGLATALVALIAQLKHQHKAGITPSYGQVDDLFDLGDRLHVALQAGAPLAAAPSCTHAGCDHHAFVEIAGMPYCAPHAADARDLLESLQTVMPAVFERVTRVEWPLGEHDETAAVCR